MRIEDKILKIIKSKREGILQNELWKIAKIDSSKCSRIITRLEKQGQITREQDSSKGTKTYLIKYQDPIEESILPASIGDQATKIDSLGFEPYVRAVAEFVMHPSTETPLVLSIEGPWGCGKSSFMLQLDNILKRNNQLTVKFNAWRYDKEDELWAAFALDFIHQLARQPKITCLSRIKLLIQRIHWKNLIFCFIFLILIYQVNFWINSFPESIRGIFKWGGLATLIAVTSAISSKLKNYIINPFDISINKYLGSPNYENHVAFIEEFHKDFKKIVNAYAGENKVYIFIDDLDRCETHKAADIMQALNLMIPNDPHLIFIIGMDREKVAASFAVKYEKLIPYLFSIKTPQEMSSNLINGQFGLEYGYEFIEKFIQLPFSVPQPDIPDLQRFLSNISNLDSETKIQSDLTIETKNPSSNSPVQSQDIIQKQNERREKIILTVTGDSQTIHDIVLMVGPALDNNPRRLKQFINLFRLRAFIANETGLFDVSEDSTSNESLTLEQLGKFVAIYLKWPLLIRDLEKNRTLLTELQFLSVRRSHNEKLIGSQIKLFCWNDIETSDKVRFIEYLSTTFLIYWDEDSNIEHTHNEIRFFDGLNHIKIKLNNDVISKATKAHLKIEFSEKTQEEQLIAIWENEELNIYKNFSEKSIYWSSNKKLMELLRAGEPHWSSNKKLMELDRAGKSHLINSRPLHGQKYNLSKLNLDKLLQVSPRIFQRHLYSDDSSSENSL